MNFAEVKTDIEKLLDLELNSIRPGSNIKIIEIKKDTIVLETKTGERNRPIEELKKIWDKLMTNPAVHVDGLLFGSGSSRNQPETILANLPYIEWLKVDNKKHIAFVGQNTHPFGTIKQMTSISAEKIASKMKNLKESMGLTKIIVTKNVAPIIKGLEKTCLCGITTAIEQGYYEFKTHTDIILFISSEICGIPEGTYGILKTDQKIIGNKVLKIGNKEYQVISNNSIKLVIEDLVEPIPQQLSLFRDY